MPNPEPPAAPSRPASPVATFTLVLTALTIVGTLVTYLALRRLELVVRELGDKVSDSEKKNQKRDEALAAQQEAVTVHAATLAKHEAHLTELARKGPGPTPPPPPPEPVKPVLHVVGSLDERVAALEVKLRDPNGKPLGDGVIGKAVQKTDVLENKLKDSSGKLLADGEIARSIQKVPVLENKLRDSEGSILSDKAIGAAIEQVWLTKADVRAITTRLAKSAAP